MRKHGRYFVSVVERGALAPAVWDPFTYRASGVLETLSNFAAMRALGSGTLPARCAPFRAIEYRDVARGPHLSFALETGAAARGLGHVGEGELLFGTMRAYLGNVLVTPRAEWLECHAPLFFSVKSEFVSIVPHDGFTYFWWAYLRSSRFLESLPPGGGGTRPRLLPKALEQMPVSVPAVEIRREIHARLEELARREWNVFCAASALLDTLSDPASP